MTAGSGVTYSDLLAEWGHDPSCSSKTCPGCCLLTTGTLWPESFTDWPQSATASPGGLWQQQPLALPTEGCVGLELLNTPTAWLGERPSRSQIPNESTQNGELTHDLQKLLPTPLAHDMKTNASPSRRNRSSPGLGAISMLLTTPPNGSDGMQEPSSDGS